MIGYVRGKVVQVMPDYCLLEVQGIGYRIFISTLTRDKLKVNCEATLNTYLYVREDALILYGFVHKEEYDLFVKLITVSGIGPKVAIGILSSISPMAFIQAIVNKDIAILTTISGIGKKTAERMILELKDKISNITLENKENIEICEPEESLQQQALAALVVLGYSQAEVVPMIRRSGQLSSVQEIIKTVLKELGGRQ